MGIDQWEWEGMGILIVFPHTSILSENTVTFIIDTIYGGLMKKGYLQMRVFNG